MVGVESAAGGRRVRQDIDLAFIRDIRASSTGSGLRVLIDARVDERFVALGADIEADESARRDCRN